MTSIVSTILSPYFFYLFSCIITFYILPLFFIFVCYYIVLLLLSFTCCLFYISTVTYQHHYICIHASGTSIHFVSYYTHTNVGGTARAVSWHVQDLSLTYRACFRTYCYYFGHQPSLLSNLLGRCVCSLNVVTVWHLFTGESEIDLVWCISLRSLFIVQIMICSVGYYSI